MATFDLAATLASIEALKKENAQLKCDNAELTKNTPTKDPPSTYEGPFDLVICTDGACTNNGKDGALAGIGVYFGPDDPRNISTPLTGPLHTNNRAELQALLYALEYVVQHPTEIVHIQSDSSYCVNGYKSWVFKWVASNWTKSDGRPVLNKDLWVKVWALKNQIKELNLESKVSWVRGHNGHEGNEEADRLAVLGVTLHPRYAPPAKSASKKRAKKTQVPKKPASIQPSDSSSPTKRKLSAVNHVSQPALSQPALST